MKKWFRAMGMLLALLLVLGFVWLGNVMLGNPVSAMLARKTAKEYLAENFSHTDYHIERIGYNFKDGNYYAHIRSDSSIDTQFTLYITKWGELRYDTYDSVTDGFVTANRLESEYRALADTILEAPDYPYKGNEGFGFGTLEIYPPEALNDPFVHDIPTYALDQSTLILDHIYDIRELGRQAGELVIYVYSDTVNAERAADIMLDIKARFDAAGIPFAAMDFVMEYPRPDDGPQPKGDVRVEDFPYDAIYEENMTQRVVEADAARRAYYAELDTRYK